MIECEIPAADKQQLRVLTPGGFRSQHCHVVRGILRAADGKKNMTAKIVRIDERKPEALKDVPAASDTAQAAAGWDPYEVWRTRILLPRIQDGERNPSAEGQVRDSDAAEPYRRNKR
jgi:hypothetical protein